MTGVLGSSQRRHPLGILACQHPAATRALHADSNTWPSWGALRQRVLLACHSVTVPGDPSVRDAFVAELVRLSPPRLRMLDLAACRHLRSVSLSPATACPALESINLRACPSLQFVLIQSVSCRQLDLTGCEAVTKVRCRLL